MSAEVKPIPRFHPLKSRSHAVARASVPLFNGVWLEGVLILKSSQGYRVHFPERRMENAPREDLWLPVLTFESDVFRERLEQRILKHYERFIQAGGVAD